jgi:hypothetical protein
LRYGEGRLEDREAMTRDYAALVKFLKTRSPDFAQAPEYQLHRGDADDLPGVILAAFGKYVGRTAREGGDTSTLLTTLEAVADWNDASIQSQLRDELFESIENDPDAERMVRGQMAGHLRDRYEQWKTAR